MKLGFLVLIGLPCSGKTTLAELLKKNYNQSKKEKYFFIHICYDELIPFSNVNEKGKWKELRNSVALEISNLIETLKNKNKAMCSSIFAEELKDLSTYDQNIVLVVDDNMYFKSMRYTLYQIAKNNAIGFCQLYIKCPLHLALINNGKRESNLKVPPHSIINMSEKIEPPDKSNNWEKFSVTVNAFSDFKDISLQLFHVLNESLHYFKYSVNSDDQEKEASALECKKNILHQVDLALRRIVGGLIKEYLLTTVCDSEKQSRILHLNHRKSEILDDIKIGNICLPNEAIEEIVQGLEKPTLITYLENYF